MKAKLEFDLNDSDDMMAHMRCVKSLDMALAMWEFHSAFHKICDESEDGKHIDEKLVREAWSDILYKYGVNLDSLIN